MLPWPYGGKYLSLSHKTHFELGQGDSLPRRESPNITGKPFDISARVKLTGENGVVVAQGGTQLGYALYLDGGRPCFAIRRSGNLSVVQADAPIEPNDFSITVRLAADGAVTLAVDGRQVASGNLPGLVPEMPVEGLEVGRDEAGSVGPYDGPNRLQGHVESLTIDLPGEEA